ncbi:hypothetical protein [Mucilaginibacter pocheonensis]|uniref:NigD-like protein n=1 Tax=Mucilaginibacter pocheonensis TaxID=398050 RepID=A0ABU1T548_9SPHI|nr:hypothetical protein [Mucilaginibacter pocheonensis]MDR6940376.1 hypothetical protein [Mucilaginibacter pocheonensis]
MKKLCLIYTLLLLSVFTSCQKDHVTKSDTSENKPPVIAAVHDSVSYTVDGKTYMVNSKSFSNPISGNQQVDQKVVNIKNGSDYEIVGNPDSVLYYRVTNIFSTDGGLSISFIKKYNKKDIKIAFLYYPKFEEMLKLYAVGKHPYAEDFGRENLQDGIALSLRVDDKSFFSYPTHDLRHISKLKPGFQQGSTFEIISFNKATSGGYNLEAKFTAVIAEDFTEDQKKVENGYLRLHLDIDPAFYPLF